MVTPTLIRPSTGIPPIFLEAFKGGEGEELSEYVEPHVICERFALVRGENISTRWLSTRFYTSAVASRPGFKQEARKRFVFPTPTSIFELVTDFREILNGLGIETELEPTDVDEKTELAVVRYTLNGSNATYWLPDNPEASLIYSAFQVIANEYRATPLEQAA